MTKYVVVQFGHAVYGMGDTPEAAVADCRRWMNCEDAEQLSVDTISRIVGTDRCAFPSWARKLMTQHGELADGDMVLMTVAEATEFGYDIPA